MSRQATVSLLIATDLMLVLDAGLYHWFGGPFLLAVYVVSVVGLLSTIAADFLDS